VLLVASETTWFVNWPLNPPALTLLPTIAATAIRYLAKSPSASNHPLRKLLKIGSSSNLVENEYA